METLYKITGPNNEACHGGWGNWPPVGVWTRPITPVIPCKRGYHLLRLTDIANWLKVDGVLWEAEGRGEKVAEPDKVVFAEARLTRKVGILGTLVCRLAAIQFAERVLPIFEKEY